CHGLAEAVFKFSSAAGRLCCRLFLQFQVALEFLPFLPERVDFGTLGRLAALRAAAAASRFQLLLELFPALDLFVELCFRHTRRFFGGLKLSAQLCLGESRLFSLSFGRVRVGGSLGRRSE